MEKDGLKRVLVVAAHPDDAEFTSGGTLAKWSAEGADIMYVVCTDGSKGSDDLDIEDTALRDLREAEQRATWLYCLSSSLPFTRGEPIGGRCFWAGSKCE